MTVTQGANTYYYHKDGLGSVVNLTDSAGNVIKTYTYKSFGEIHSETGSLVQPLTFTGREYDSESGLYFYRARYYDPRSGTFLTKDPISFAGGDMNLYRYVRNNPANFADPFGLWPTPVHNAIIDTAFSKLDPMLREAIKMGSRYADSLRFQSPEYAYMHAMRSGIFESIPVAKQRMENYIREHLNQHKCEGNLYEACFSLGMALHPVMDSNSPTHEGYQIAFYGFNYYHWLGEISASSQQIQEAVDNINQTLLKFNIPPR